jgi:rhodanese-related sulfurtransferase
LRQIKVGAGGCVSLSTWPLGTGGACLEVNMPVRTVDPATASIWIKQSGAILVDVREPAEYRAAHIPQARLMPLSEIDVGRLPAGKKIVVHCAKGGRGHTACEKLLQQNPSLEVFNLSGGIEGWSAAGLPVERAM